MKFISQKTKDKIKETIKDYLESFISKYLTKQVTKNAIDVFIYNPKSFVEEVNEAIQINKEAKPKLFEENLISDGYHTFDDLYDCRRALNIAWFNECASGSPFLFNSTEIKPLHDVHKSWKHNDGEYCFGKEKEWFIVSALLPTGLISFHYRAEYWDLFKIPTVEKAKYKFDGHDTQDVVDRIESLVWYLENENGK